MSTILVVDDEPDERFLLRRMFEREGYEVLDACDGAAALAIVRESPPDLILTDMMMPVMDGAELIRRLRSDPATAGIPILASTGDPGLAGSADVVMSKSLPLEDLAAAVRACLSERRDRPAAVSARLEEGRDQLRLMSTGIAGLDLVLNGGLERGSVVVLAGAPGTGKTILAQQICFARATTAHKAVYYTTVSEPHTKLVRHLEPFAFFDREALGTTVEYIHLGSFLVPAERGRAGAAGLGDRPEDAGGRARRRGGRQQQDAARLRRRTPDALRALQPDQPHGPHRHGAAAGR